MDVRIENGDIVVNDNGGYDMISGLDEVVQRVRMVALTDRGSFIYDRELGVDYDELNENENAAGQLDLLIKEATVDIGGAETEVLSYDAENRIISIKVNYHGRSAVTEVDISGII